MAAFATLLAVSAIAAEVSEDPPVVSEEFVSQVAPLVRDFIADKYADYGKGKVTMRHLKQHLVDRGVMGMTYEEFSEDHYSAVIEDEVDNIVSRCDGGKKKVSCVHDFRSVPGVDKK